MEDGHNGLFHLIPLWMIFYQCPEGILSLVQGGPRLILMKGRGYYLIVSRGESINNYYDIQGDTLPLLGDFPSRNYGINNIICVKEEQSFI